jgi:arylsulfatase A-like enzyme
MHLGEHDLRIGKRTAYDTDVRVPLVVTGPGVPAGRTIDQFASNIDLAPTYETIAGAVPPATVDGRSLAAQIHGGLPADWRTGVLIEHHGVGNRRNDPDDQPPLGGNPPSYEAIRTADYLYVDYVDGEREYYDLRSDPFELDNRYGSLPRAMRERLHAAARRQAQCSGTASCWAAQRALP